MSDKGSFKAEISQSVIEAALASVRKRTGEETAASEVPVEVGTEGTPGTAEAPPVSNAEVEALKAQLEVSLAKGRELMDRIKDEHDRVLRATADLENFKKRAAKEKEEVQKFGIEKLLKDFLPVVDNFDRAMEHAATTTDLESLKQGLQMTRKLFEDTLGKHGVKPFGSKGKPFDPNFHEAMQQLETDEMPPNHVAQEVLRGFMLNERLVRPALVMVSKAKSAAPAPATPNSEEPPAGNT